MIYFCVCGNKCTANNNHPQLQLNWSQSTAGMSPGWDRRGQVVRFTVPFYQLGKNALCLKKLIPGKLPWGQAGQIKHTTILLESLVLEEGILNSLGYNIHQHLR